MSQSNYFGERTFIAGADLTSSKYCLVKLHTDGTVIVATANTDNIVGVLQNKPASGENALVRFKGTSKVKTGGAISIGAWVSATTAGAGVAVAADRKVALGRALEAADSGDVIEVQLGIFTTSI